MKLDGLEALPVALMLRKSQPFKGLEQNILDRRVNKCKGSQGNGTWCVREPERTVGQSLVREGREGRIEVRGQQSRSCRAFGHSCSRVYSLT